MRYFKKIAGERLYLSPINPDDAEAYTKWLNDYAVGGNLGNYTRLISLQNERPALERMAAEGQNYAIVLNDADTLVGNISLMELDHVSRTASVGLFIGEAEHRGKGYGGEALRLILNYGFGMLNLHNIMLMAHADNAQGLACYKKAGFREFGRRREAKYKNGRYIDVVYMELLADQFCTG